VFADISMKTVFMLRMTTEVRSVSMCFIVSNSVIPVNTNITLLVKQLSVLLHSWTHIRCQSYIHAKKTHSAVNVTNAVLLPHLIPDTEVK